MSTDDPGHLTLRIPEPRYRPGDIPDYADIDVPEPGDTRRPEPDANASEMRDCGYGIMRVLDDDGVAQGPWDPGLTEDELVFGLRSMLRVREFDRRMLVQQRTGKTSFYMQCLGEEAIACGLQAELEPGDMNFPTYRQQGLLITAGYPLVDMMCQIFSNENDPLKGRQLPIMYSSKEYGFFTISGNLATQFVQAVGWAMASAIKQDTAIATGWIGDGSTAESDFHSALVFASTYHAPVILNIVNNQWAISTHAAIALGDAETFASRGHGFGIASLRVDGNDYLAVRAASRWAAERARTNSGPTLIEWVTYRQGSHSTSDDPGKYRPAEGGKFWPLGDPVDRLREHMTKLGIWDDAKHDAAIGEIEVEMNTALEEAESHGTLHEGPHPSRDIFEGVFEHMPPHLEAQRREAGL